MRIKKGFELREVCGEYIIVAYGKENIDFNKVISLNESASFLWKAIADKNFTADTLSSLSKSVAMPSIVCLDVASCMVRCSTIRIW